jgi:malonyl-ACP decarboxylase
MRGSDRIDIAVSGVGVTSAIGQGQGAFLSALMQGQHAFGVMSRPGRQLPQASSTQAAAFLGAEIASLAMPAGLPPAMLRTASFSAQVVLATLHEAWQDAQLAPLAQTSPERIGLVVGGSNVQQRESMLAREAYRGREGFLRPTYGLSFMDSDLCGLCTEQFGIRGFAHTVGGASASGQLAVIEAIEAVQSGRVDVCIAVGAPMDLSYWECQAFRSLGAMGSDRFAQDPASACRPFDRDRDGFIFGEACGAVVVEARDSAWRRTGRQPYARLPGWAVRMDANRQPNPSAEGQMATIRAALDRAQLTPGDIDYVNPHGSGSGIGDEVELRSLRDSGLGHVRINTTKSVTGHALTAAGAVELIAVLLQMGAGQLHPSRNLDHPIDAGMGFTGAHAEDHAIANALNLSIGFGGINTAVCVQRCT